MISQEYRNVPVYCSVSHVCCKANGFWEHLLYRLSVSSPRIKPQSPCEGDGTEKKGDRTEVGGQEGIIYVLESVLGNTLICKREHFLFDC